jgi:nicotinate-nucleotide pyrophosphorylase (carboxylating)
VRCGGGVNQRMNLYEAVMVKDNHLEAIRYDWKKLKKALSRARGKPIIIEVDRLSFLPEAIKLNPHIILLDNMKVSEVKEAVRMIRKSKQKILLEASGSVSLAQVRRYARTGVERISIGALTHSAPHVNFSLELLPSS